MAENIENPNEDLSDHKEFVKQDFKSFFGSIKAYLIQLLDIREGTDRKETIDKIKAGIPVKNHTAWILIFSIFIASIGLNTSSPAVVIGAMLVSPLMGPILGVGLSIGINDIDTLRRSLINLGVMIGLSLVTSFIFFSIPLFQDATPELLARTKPDVRDVLIAIAGGLALIVALSRHKEMTNTIAGIAIATALMPPLCTAGYGLATWNLHYFGGAMFLFTINAIFIALATFVIVKFLQFPMVRYINSVKRKRIAQLASTLAIIVLGFSIYLFYGLFEQKQYNRNAKKFIAGLKEKTEAGIIKNEVNFDERTIKLVVLGNNLERKELEEWKLKLPEYGIANTKIEIHQDDKSAKLQDQIDIIKDSYIKNQELIAAKDASIVEKESLIKSLTTRLENIEKNEIPFLQISKEIKINHQDINEISFSNLINTDFTKIDTVPVFYIEWLPTTENIDAKQNQIESWLKTRLKSNTIEVINTTTILEEETKKEAAE